MLKDFQCFIKHRRINVCVEAMDGSHFISTELGLNSWGGEKGFLLLLIVQTSSGAYPASDPVGISGSFPSSTAAVAHG
jgi:hypothetical protein